MGSSGYKKIKDEDVINVWTCHDCVVDVEVSPTFYEDAGTPMCKKCGRDMSYSETMVRTPRVILFVEGGVVHDAMSDTPVTLRIVDYDVEGQMGANFIKLPRGGKELCYVSKYDLDGIEDLNPFFKQKAIK